MSAIFSCHYLVVVLLRFRFSQTWRRYNSIPSCFLFFFVFSTSKNSLKTPLHCQAGVWGEFWRRVWTFFKSCLSWGFGRKAIICILRAIFTCWPTREHSVFDMPVVLAKKGRSACLWVYFPYRSVICSAGFDRQSWNAIQWFLEREERRTRWSDRLKRSEKMQIKWNCARVSWVTVCLFPLCFSLLLLRISSSILLPVNTEWIESDKVSLIQWESVHDSLALHTI